ncbi:MAG: hypothetical protein ACLTT1_16165 [[Clostridium] scindens]
MPDVDIAITTRELARLIERAASTSPLFRTKNLMIRWDVSTGAAVIFGATGGVMEAALRTAVETLTGEELAKLDFTDVRGTEGVKGSHLQCSWHGCEGSSGIRPWQRKNTA